MSTKQLNKNIKIVEGFEAFLDFYTEVIEKDIISIRIIEQIWKYRLNVLKELFSDISKNKTITSI